MAKPLAALAVLAVLLAGGATAAQEPAKVWEARGFANPESVVWDAAHRVLYVSNVNGLPVDKDGNGTISKLSPDGHVLAQTWVSGLDGPKGMAVYAGRLYVADIDRLVVIDTASGKLIKTYPAEGARFLNDVTVDDRGVIYVSDMLADSIWRLAEGRLELWLTDPALHAPNGLKAEHDRLVVASWGSTTEPKLPGGVEVVNFTDRGVRVLAPPLGNLGGIEPDGNGGYLVSDTVKGLVLRVSRTGRARTLLKLSQGSADIGLIPEQSLLVVPMMQDGTVAAYRLK